jgi:SHS2 domain-containing protein
MQKVECGRKRPLPLSGLQHSTFDIQHFMPYQFLDHTADVAVRVTAASLDRLFEEAAAALTATVVEASGVRAERRVEVTLEASAPDLLLVDWLTELVYRFDTDGWLTARAAARVGRTGDAWRLEAACAGEPLDETRHRVKALVKGVTYHQLAIRETAEGVETVVVFDV